MDCDSSGTYTRTVAIHLLPPPAGGVMFDPYLSVCFFLFASKITQKAVGDFRKIWRIGILWISEELITFWKVRRHG